MLRVDARFLRESAVRIIKATEDAYRVAREQTQQDPYQARLLVFPDQHFGRFDNRDYVVSYVEAQALHGGASDS